MKLLLAGDSQFMESKYALAELAVIREVFLAAYPSVYEREHGERGPSLRRVRSGATSVRSSHRPQEDRMVSGESDVSTGTSAGYDDETGEYEVDIEQLNPNLS